MHAFRMYALQCIDSPEINKNMLWVGYFLYIFLINMKNTMVLICVEQKSSSHLVTSSTTVIYIYYIMAFST